jgi:cell fate (sporulation/competence/biofilm development) regulator YlbF (YheA/YmcA/DUF963 family)
MGQEINGVGRISLDGIFCLPDPVSYWLGGCQMNTLELAREFAKSLANCPEYLNYKAAKEKLGRHEAAKMMFDNFRKKQFELERRKQNGEKGLETAENELRKLAEVVNLNLLVRDYLMAEYQFSKLMMEIQQLLAEAVEVKLPQTENQQSV